MDLTPEQQQKIISFFRIPVALAGAIIGGAVAGSIGSPAEGGAIGGAVGVTIAGLGEMAARQLSQREIFRIGNAATAAIELVQEYRDAGMLLRDDGFFNQDATNRSAADQIIEGVLITSKKAYEEKKVPYIGYILTNTAFRMDVSPEDTYFVLTIAERFTYQQLCIIALLHRDRDVRGEHEWWAPYNRPGKFSVILQQLRDIGTVIEPLGNAEAPPTLSATGNLAFELMSLDRLPQDDLRRVEELFLKNLGE